MNKLKGRYHYPYVIAVSINKLFYMTYDGNVQVFSYKITFSKI